MRRYALLCLMLVTFLSGCDQAPDPIENATPAVPPKPTATVTKQAEPDLTVPVDPATISPSPPIFEDFEGQPQLSLFPRVGDYRPEENSDRLPFWQTFIEHLTRTSGVTSIPGTDTGNRVWSFHSISSINSIGFFSPIAVKPNTSYKVDFFSKALCRKRPVPVSASSNLTSFSGTPISSLNHCSGNTYSAAGKACV